MIASPALTWTLTVVFAGTGGYCLLRCCVPARAGAPPAVLHRVADGWHAVMALGMVAMLWPWGMRIPPPLECAVFGAGAVFFAVQLVRPPAGHGRTGLAHHALMMLAMVWMAVAMPLSMGVGSVGTTTLPGMPGMSMPGPGDAGGPPTAVLLTGIAAASCLVVGTLHWTARNIDRVRDATAPDAGSCATSAWQPVGQTGCHAAMSLGMATMLVVML